MWVRWIWFGVGFKEMVLVFVRDYYISKSVIGFIWLNCDNDDFFVNFYCFIGLLMFLLLL